MSEITQGQNIRLNLLALVNYDTAAAAKAIAFVGDDPLKDAVFQQQYARVTSENETVAKTLKAIQEATEALALFTDQTS